MFKTFVRAVLSALLLASALQPALVLADSRAVPKPTPKLTATQKAAKTPPTKPSPSLNTGVDTTKKGTALPITITATADWHSKWKVIDIEGSKESYKNLEIAKDASEHPTFFRVHFPKGSGDRLLWKFMDKPLGGVVSWVVPGFQPRAELYLRYYVRFPQDFDFRTTGALPGVLTGSQNGRTEQQDKSESAGTVYLWWNEKGELQIEGGHVPFDRMAGPYALLADGKWHTIDLYVRLNSRPGKTDGGIQAWLDGQSLLQAGTKALYNNRAGDLWDTLAFWSSVSDGQNVFTAAPKDMYLDIADISFSEKPFSSPAGK